MASFIKQGLVVRRLKYMSHRLMSDELYGPRELGDTMQKILPPVTQRKHSAHSGCIIGIPPKHFQVRFSKFKSIFKLSPNPKDTNGEDKSEATKQREEEVKKLQDLRQRNIDHNFHKESVWKALEERDEFFKQREKDSKNGKEDN